MEHGLYMPRKIVARLLRQYGLVQVASFQARIGAASVLLSPYFGLLYIRSCPLRLYMRLDQYIRNVSNMQEKDSVPFASSAGRQSVSNSRSAWTILSLPAGVCKAGIVAYILFCNNERPHAALGCQSPVRSEVSKALTNRESNWTTG